MNVTRFRGVTAMISCVVLICVVPISAGRAGAQDLLYYYTSALKNDPQFKGSQYDYLASRETVRQAYAGLLPRVSANVGYMITYQDVNNSDNRVYATGSTDYDTQTYGVSVVQPIFRYASYKSVTHARTVSDRAELELEKARQDLALRVVESYMEVLLAKDRLAAVKAEETAVEQHYVVAQERADKGMGPITNRYDTEARLASVQAQRIEAESNLTDALQALTEICGEPVQEVRLLKETIPMVSPFPEGIQHWSEAGVKQNLDILIQKLYADGAEKEIEKQKAAHYPTLEFKFDFENRDTKGSLFGGGSNTSNYELLFMLSIPIYEGGLTVSKTREAANLHQSSLQKVTKQTRAAERKVRSTYTGVVSGITRVNSLKKSIEAQMLVVEAKEEGFKAGLQISLAVLDAMQDLYRYRKEYSQARNDYILNSFRLKHAVGTLKPEEISLVNGWLQN